MDEPRVEKYAVVEIQRDRWPDGNHTWRVTAWDGERSPRTIIAHSEFGSTDRQIEDLLASVDALTVTEAGVSSYFGFSDKPRLLDNA